MGGRKAVLWQMRAILLAVAWILSGCGPTTSSATDPEAARNRMVQEQLILRGIRDERVLGAMRAVPRHELVATELRTRAYEDSALPIGHGQTISQPYVVAFMTEQ